MGLDLFIFSEIFCMTCKFCKSWFGPRDGAGMSQPVVQFHDSVLVVLVHTTFESGMDAAGCGDRLYSRHTEILLNETEGVFESSARNTLAAIPQYLWR